MPLPSLEVAQQVFDTMEQYHSNREAEASAMGFDESAVWHSGVARWLRRFASEKYQQALDHERFELLNRLERQYYYPEEPPPAPISVEVAPIAQVQIKEPTCKNPHPANEYCDDCLPF